MNARWIAKNADGLFFNGFGANCVLQFSNRHCLIMTWEEVKENADEFPELIPLRFPDYS